MMRICACRQQGCGCKQQMGRIQAVVCDRCDHGEHIEQAELNRLEDTTRQIHWNMEGDKTKLALRGPYLQRVDIDSAEMEGYIYLDVECERAHGDDESIVLTLTREHALQLVNMITEGLLKVPEED